MELLIITLKNPVVLMLLGMVASFVQRLADLNAQGKTVSPIQYIKQNPYRIIVTGLGLIISYALILDYEIALSSLELIMIGFGASSIIDTLSEQASKRNPLVKK